MFNKKNNTHKNNNNRDLLRLLHIVTNSLIAPVHVSAIKDFDPKNENLKYRRESSQNMKKRKVKKREGEKSRHY